MKYNHIIFAGDYDYNRILYRELYGEEGICYVDGVGKAHSPLRLLHRIHTSPKLNSLVFNFPGKELWYRRYFKNPFTGNKPLCFCFHASYLLTIYRFGTFIEILRKNYPSARFVLFYEDRICSFDSSISPAAVRNQFDLLVSYDYAESEKYDIAYFPTVASEVRVRRFATGVKRSDVYLLAFAKDRFPKYLDLYEYLTSNGIVCDFNILGVPKSERVSNGINFLSRPMSYMRNLQHVVKTKCILDIQQYEAVGFTLRLWEAILNDKKILTDNKMIQESQYYDPRYVSLIKDGKPDLDFIRSDEEYVNPHKHEISPMRFIEFLDSILI